jgi:heat-inducible transcriptional repressor
MSDLEVRGFLYHTHTSAGRIPTDLAYRVYVDRLMRQEPPSDRDRQRIETEVASGGSAIEELLRRAAQVLGVLTRELGVAVAPAFDAAILERLELARLSSDRLLVVLTLQSGLVRTIFVEVASALAPEVVEQVARILNERLAGVPLGEIRATVGERLRDAGATDAGSELLNVFVAQSEELFEVRTEGGGVMLGSAQPLADQPEFASNGRMRELLELTERRDLLCRAFDAHRMRGLVITIGTENADPRLADFTLVTSSYRHGGLTGVLGVIGPTRMPYDKIIGLVDHTSRLVEGLVQ